MATLTDEARHALLSELRNWTDVDGRDAIEKTFQFKNFKDAWGFMSQAALAAEQADHHPEWFNVYGRVHVLLTTHDAGGVTEKDAALARFMDACAARLGA